MINLLVFVWMAVLLARPTCAADLDSFEQADLQPESFANSVLRDREELVVEEISYEPSFIGADRGIIGRRADEVAPTGLPNNIPVDMNVIGGATPLYFVFSNESLWSIPYKNDSSTARALALMERENGSTADLEIIDLQMAEEDTNVDAGEEEAHVRPRQLPTRPVYITLTTCLQPTNPKDPTGAQGPPGQLELYVSQTEKNPGPNKTASTQIFQRAEHGFANITVRASSNVYVGVYAPATAGFPASAENAYNMHVAASIEAQYHSIEKSEPNLYFIDSDADSVLLATRLLTSSTNGTTFEKYMSMTPPYVVFANNYTTRSMEGVEHSFCGLESKSQIRGTKNGGRTDAIQTSITAKTFGPHPKQQFYFRGLSQNSVYLGTLALAGNATASGPGVVGGGGKVFRQMNFTTQSASNCAVIFNLTFCDSVAYAVPGNPNTFPSPTDLANFYDNMAQSQYANFDKALQQIPCEIPSNGQYSLARNCTDCARAYKDWLCAVTIPRCVDYSSNDTFLQPRNMVQKFPDNTFLDNATVAAAQSALYLNSSRNPTIDEVVQPGPYKEILPCDYLCYDLVKSCPSVMNFACPMPGHLGFNRSYGQYSTDGTLKCNYPYSAHGLSRGATNVVPSLGALLLISILAALLI